jgi:hypothetical protein
LNDGERALVHGLAVRRECLVGRYGDGRETLCVSTPVLAQHPILVSPPAMTVLKTSGSPEGF